MKKKKPTKRKAKSAPKRAGTTFVSYLLDETGSMRTVRDATIRAFNEYLDSLEGGKDRCLVTVVSFNSGLTKQRALAADPSAVERLTTGNYYPCAVTPLYDAIWDIIQGTEARIKEAKGNPAVVFVIQTDGMENASTRRTRDDIFREIEARKKLGWVFVFLGADQDAYAAAQLVGIDRGNTLSYGGSPIGTQVTSSALAQATLRYRGASGGTTMSTSNFFTPDEQKEAEKTKTK